MTDDAGRLLERVRALRNPRYPDALALLGTHARATAAVAELEAAGLLEHRTNGQLAYLGPSILTDRRRAVAEAVRQVPES